MTLLLSFLLALFAHLAHLTPAPAVAAPAPVVHVAVPRVHRGAVAPAPARTTSDERTRPAPAAVTVPAAPVPAPGPDSPVCDAGQTPAVDGCAQGQLPEETTGRAYG